MIGFLQLMVTAASAWASAYYAEKNGRNELFWFVMGIFFSVFALVAVLMLPSLKSHHSRGRDRSYSSQEIEVEPLEVKVDSPAPSYNWYYLDKNQCQKGPVSFHRLRELWREKEVFTDTYVWSESMNEWCRVNELDDVHQQLAKQ